MRLAALLITALLAAAPAAWAQPAAPPAPAPVMPSPVPAKAEIAVMVVDAARSDAPSDPRLEALLPTLRGTGFTSFQLVDHKRVRVADGEKEGVGLATGQTLTVSMLSHDLTTARVQLVLTHGSSTLVDTVISVARNKAFYLAVRGHEGKTMILPVSVRY